jgi:hypothetical protein
MLIHPFSPFVAPSPALEPATFRLEALKRNIEGAKNGKNLMGIIMRMPANGTGSLLP